MSEASEQVTLFEWVKLHVFKWPCLDNMYYIPNEGLHKVQYRMKQLRMGLKPGIPDTCLPAARQGYHGLYIEMKDGNRPTTKNQDKRIAGLKEEGYRVEIAHSANEAIDILVDYLTNRKEI